MPYTGPVIDVHAHTFRAKELPIKGFLKNVKGVPAPLADLVDKVSQRGKITRVIFGSLGIFTSALNALGILPSVAKSYVAWAKLLGRSNKTIIKKMTKVFPDIVLFTPLMMDMEFWVGDKPKWSVAKQIRKTKKRIKQFPGIIHPFIAFDPERQRQANKQNALAGSKVVDTPLDGVAEAMEEHGFIGVKIYPPLGFRPTDNVAINPDPTQGELNELVLQVDPTSDVAETLQGWDSALEELYCYCEREEVPITAHCTPGGAGAFGMHANPIYWEQVLRNHNDLRLNLAHFGKDLIDPDNPAYDPTTGWTWKIGDLMDNFPHVYADTGAHKEIYNIRTRQMYFANLQRLFQAFQQAPKRYMYGTDWHMIIRHGKRYKKFYDLHSDSYTDWYSLNNYQVEDFFEKNARRFLGIDAAGPGHGKNHTRLSRFYSINGLPRPIWLP